MQTFTLDDLAFMGATKLPLSDTVVFIIAGQSNAEGDNSTTFTYDFQRTDTYFKTDYTSTADNGTFQDLQFGVNNSTGTAESDSEAEPMVYIAKTFEETYSNNLKAIKVAIGGTGFNNGSGLWASTGALRNALKNHYVKPALSKLQASGGSIQLMPFLFIQGESDATVLADANGYQTQLQSLITDLRSYTGISDFPIVLVRLNSAAPYTYKTTIQAAQDAIDTADANVYLINPDSFTQAPDNIHYTAAGYQQIAAAYLSLFATIGAKSWPGDSVVEITAAPSLFTRTATTLTFSATAVEYATLYVGVYASGSSNPGQSAIIAGTGAGYVARSSAALVYGVSGNTTITGLTLNTSYTCFAFLQDLAGNQSSVVTIATATLSNNVANNYENAVIAAGGALASNAKTLLADALTTTYNGLVFADYSSKFRLLWIPLSNFAAIQVPVIGANFTNTGYISGDWNINTGLLGGTNKYLTTGLTPVSGEANDTTIAVSTTSLGTGYLCSAYDSSTSAVALGGSNINLYATSGTTGEVPHGVSASAAQTIVGVRNASTNFRTFNGETQNAIATSSSGIGTIPTSQPLIIGGIIISGSPQNFYTGRLDAVGYATALTDAERISFTRMIAAIRTGRASLADITAPILSTATVNGSTLILTYDESLSGSSVPATTDYTITVNAVSRSISSVAVTGSTVVITLSSGVSSGNTVLLNYTPGANPVRDATGNNAASLSARAITVVVYDTDAQTIITAIETADSASLETVVRDAINTFVVGCKADGTWTGLNSGTFRFLAGPRTLAGCFKAGVGADPTNVGFVSGDLTRATGIIGNGSSKYLNSNRAINADSQNAHHFSVYVRRNSTTINEYLMGGRSSGSDAGAKALVFVSGDLFMRSISVPNSDSSVTSGTATPNNVASLVGVRRASSTSYNEISSSTVVTNTVTSTTPVNANIWIFGNNNNGSLQSPTGARIPFYSIGGDLGSGGLASLNTRVNNYLSAIASI